MPRLLFVKSRTASFIELDQQLLAERFDVHVIHQPGRFSDPRVVLREVWAADVIVGWWASWHTFLPFTLAWLLRKPSLLIVGGFDTAAEPEYNYGFQLGGPRAWLSRVTMRSARTLMTNSGYSREEIHRNIGIGPEHVRLVYHGVPDDHTAAGPLPSGLIGDPDRPTVITVGIVDATNLERKGIRTFVQAAEHVPEVNFVVAGKIVGDAGAELERIAASNVHLTGWLGHDELQSLLRRARVYVQASRHEGFGVSVAEAMLARCVPVATRAGALPEVVGDTGILLDDGSPEAVALGVREALHLDLGDSARRRVLERFSVQQRRDGLFALLDETTGARAS
ncbi:MAG TPA: glycosyltransferase family 4 protein [Solirubrobacteraceae bacterium]|jgi:glycosyltransferase involved in cell wall biosynthesis|nr:glycosyltransferase family 4 protein [Solirubrobacteraceae bacterium]